jgi:ABC-type Fe3+-siderophore transport system permease subunit
MTAAARLAGLGLRIPRAVVGWVFRKPRWLFPLRLLVLAAAMVLAANMVTAAPSPASHHVTTTTHAHGGWR